jgi:dTDP-4-dehydrorhamnose reductase
MLGRSIGRVLALTPGLEVITATRRGGDGALRFDAAEDSVAELLERARCEWVVNAIGILRRRINEADPASVATAIEINAVFPQRLAAAAGQEATVIQIATDGVFSGSGAPYDEGALHDATDIYGRSKSLGEARGQVLNLRCSIVGPEAPPARSLLGWALSQPPDAEIVGYSNHRWNGLTILHFGRVCAALIRDDRAELPSPLHLVPADVVSKAELLTLCLSAFGRDDVTVSAAPADCAVDRTLSSMYPEANRELWAAAGYAKLPTIAEMVAELAAFAR